MTVPFRIRMTDDRDPELSRREHHRITRAAMLNVGIKYATDLLPEHFQKGKQDQFGYAARTGQYLIRKRRLFNIGYAIEPDTDLVLTGRLKNMVLTSARQNIRAFPTRCNVRMSGPKYFTLRARASHTKRLAEEVTSMSRRHLDMLDRAAERGWSDEWRAVHQSRRLRKTTTTRS